MNDSISFLGLLEDEDIELDSAAFALSALDHEGVLLDPYVDIFKAITASLGRQVGAADTGEQRAAILYERMTVVAPDSGRAVVECRPDQRPQHRRGLRDAWATRPAPVMPACSY